MSSPPTISVVIPTYNLEAFVRDSVGSVLRQTSLPDEIIIIDDGSTDRTAEVVESAVASAPGGLVRVLRMRHAGPSAARNRGVEEARGDWIAFLDGDDQWLPEKIRRVRSAISANSDAGIITHDDIEVRPDGRETIRFLHSRFDMAKPLFPQLYRRASFATSCMTVLRSAVKAAGGFDRRLAASQDYNLWLSIARRHRAVFLPEALTRYVLRQGSISTRLGLRFRCAIAIAFRHAPDLIPFTGRLKAYLLRWRLVLMSHYAFAVRLRRASDVLEFLAMTPRMAWELSRALVVPIGSTGGSLLLDGRDQQGAEPQAMGEDPGDGVGDHPKNGRLKCARWKRE